MHAREEDRIALCATRRDARDRWISHSSRLGEEEGGGYTRSFYSSLLYCVCSRDLSYPPASFRSGSREVADYDHDHGHERRTHPRLNLSPAKLPSFKFQVSSSPPGEKPSAGMIQIIFHLYPLLSSSSPIASPSSSSSSPSRTSNLHTTTKTVGGYSYITTTARNVGGRTRAAGSESVPREPR
jgi:hypothetical protein